MTKTTRVFKKEKTTENTVMFKEVPPPENPPIVGRLYLQQWFAGQVDTITVTVEAGSK